MKEGKNKMKKRFNFYNGLIHNHENKRPQLNSICYKVSNDWKVNEKQEYILINILVHSGKYDSYVIKNQETGKITTVKKIAALMPETIYKGKTFFLNQSKKFDRDFYIVKSILDKKPEDINTSDKIQLCLIYSVAFHESGKIEGISSADSTATNCTFCQAMRKAASGDENHICNHCYDVKQENFKSVHVLNRHTLNLLIMSSIEFSESELCCVSGITNLFRINSSGDIENVTHAINMLRLIKVNIHASTALWSKNKAAIKAALKKVKKPSNCVLIQSDPVINGNTEKDPDFDYIFRVCTKDKIDAAIKSGMSECNGKKCVDCGFKCYYGTHSSDEIVEVLR